MGYYKVILKDSDISVSINSKEYTTLLFEQKLFIQGSCLTLPQVEKIYHIKEILVWEKPKKLPEDTTVEN